ncbi:MAG: ribonuclease P protein component [Myxococcota bacterium]|nr:ribonuclease P protein component [Myxococcota bacterium]
MGEITGRFGRADRLLDSREFQRISREARRVASAEFVMLIGRSPSPGRRRLGISASRRVGNAVVRNRIKRAVREWFRRRRDQLPGDIDLVVIARRKAARMPRGSAVAEALDGTFERSEKQKRGSR